MVSLRTLVFLLTAAVCCFKPSMAWSQVLDKRALLEGEDFWDNRDWSWYEANIPFFECPDREITTTYYYRWDLLTKHLTYGSPNTGYLFTEFIDRPFWSGAYGAISCPAGHQLSEARWLRSPIVAQDYSRYWLRTPGAQPRNYSTWLADSVWEMNLVHRDDAFTVDLLPDLIANYRGWEERQFVPEVGLFWQTGHDDGMEFNINSRQTQDILRGAPSYRPSFNAYMWADAMAIAKLARLDGQGDVAERFESKAASLKEKMIELLWDERRQFFFPVFKNDEERDGYKIKALTKTYEMGQFAGDPHGRELIGYVPWQFQMFTDRRFDIAWNKLMDRDGFYANFGPSTVERHDPMFLLQKSCCWWSGQSWPYATTQTLKAMANLIQRGNEVVDRDDYVELLGIYAKSHRKDGRPYLAEALHPDTGSFEGHDGYNHSEHYLHSGFCDLVITGLVGLRPRADDAIELVPLAPADWDYFALDDVTYRGHRLSVLWDRTGERYGRGVGLRILVDGQEVASAADLAPITIEGAVPLTSKSRIGSELPRQVNFAVNNDGTYYPRLMASYSSPQTPLSKVNDGNYWYLQHPPNRWTCEGSSNASDWLEVDFGTPRKIETVKCYILDDGEGSAVRAPTSMQLEIWADGAWEEVIVGSDHDWNRPLGGRPGVVQLGDVLTSKLRVTLRHTAGAKSGLTEIEAWGPAELPVTTVPPPSGNLAFNPGTEPFPRATASYSDRFGGQPPRAIDGRVIFTPTPLNRWTSYESPNKSDWFEVDFGQPRTASRVELYLYDDRGGVQPPREYWIEYWTGTRWEKVERELHSPEQPVGSAINTATFQPVETTKLRAVFVHDRQARSGLTEIEVWEE